MEEGAFAPSLSTTSEVILSLIMYDSIHPETQFGGLAMDAAAGYVDGNWPTFSTLGQYVPQGTYLLSITVFGNVAEAVDVETGDLTVDEGAAWARAMLAIGHWRPVVYTQANNLSAMITTLGSMGVSRSSVRLWSAHYTFTPHICGPTSCGFPAADGTQWTDSAFGRNLDESLLPDWFFTRPVPTPPPTASAQEDEEMLITFGSDGRAGIPVPADVDTIRLTCWQGAEVTVSWPGVSGNTPVSLDGTATGRVDVPIPAGQTGQCVLTLTKAAPNNGPVYAVFFKSS